MRNPSESVEVAVQPNTVVGDISGSDLSVILATGGTFPGSASTFNSALAVMFTPLSSDSTEI
jgi:hypothetical protein